MESSYRKVGRSAAQGSDATVSALHFSPSSQSGEHALSPFRNARQLHEQTRVVELHSSLIKHMALLCGGMAGFCYCGRYLLTEQVVGSQVEGERVAALRPVDLGFLRTICTPESGGLLDVRYRVLPAPLADTPWLQALTGSYKGGCGALMLVPLVAGGQLFGMVAVKMFEPSQPALVLRRVQELGELLGSFAAAFLRHQELERLIDVTGHLANFDGVCVVFDVDEQQLIWIGSRSPHPRLEHEVLAAAPSLLNFALRAANRCGTDPPLPYPVLMHGAVVHLLDNKALPTFGAGRHAVLAIRPYVGVERPDLRSASLSAREDQVGRLLTDGYTIANSAAILGLTENTVRTYVRRLYRKLGVNTRAELVRRLHTHGT